MDSFSESVVTGKTASSPGKRTIIGGFSIIANGVSEMGKWCLRFSISLDELTETGGDRWVERETYVDGGMEVECTAYYGRDAQKRQ